MAKEDTEHSSDTAAVEKGLGVLDRAWDAHWALRLACLILFLDMAMMLRVGRGLCQWSAGDGSLLNDIGGIALTLVAFSTGVAIVIPVVVYALRDLFTAIWMQWPVWFAASDDRPYQRPLGYVPATAFHKLALRERDSFLLRIYEAHEHGKSMARKLRVRSAELTAAALLTALADWILARHVPGGVGLIGALVDALSSWSSIVVPGVVLCAGLILKWAWFSEVPPDLIYYPPLDDELRRKEREERGIS